MTRERKLYLVKGTGTPPADAELPADAPPTPEEERAAEALREAIEGGDEPISSSLRAAWSPDAVPAGDHETLLARAMEAADARTSVVLSEDGEAPATEAELRAAARLRDALDAPIGSLSPAVSEAGLDAEFLRSLRPARSPARLEERAHERILDRVLADPLAPATNEERTAADGLRAALEGGGDAPVLVRALRAAERPGALDPARNEEIIARALQPARMRGRVISIVGAALAMAACVALVATQGLRDAPNEDRAAPMAAAAAEFIPSRSTAALFDASEPFPRSGGESKRIDRIFEARAADLRANRFAAWGLR